MKSEFEIAITQLSSDRNLAPEVIIEAIEAALVSAYKRNFDADENVGVSLDPHTGEARVFVRKVVAEKVGDEQAQISLEEARAYKPNPAVGDVIEIELKPRNFGRIAAQTAKQVIMQRIREAERDSVYLEYADRSGEIVNGIVRNVDQRTGNVTVSLGKAEAVMPRSEQIPGEHYRFNQRLRVYVVEVERTSHGPQITVSRTHRGLLRRLLELEVPEIYNGTVEIKAIAREAGSRSKVAVAALQAGVDPVGACVGMRGVRIQNIVNELNGEKIDVVPWASDIEGFIANALSPAKVVRVYLNEAEKAAKVVVPDRSLSLAIGREGQNARLAAKLTGWRIDIRSETEAAEEAEKLAAEALEAATRAQELEEARQAAANLLAEAEALIDDDEALDEVTEQVEEALGGPLPEPTLAVPAEEMTKAAEGESADEEMAIAREAAMGTEVEPAVAETEVEAEVAPEAEVEPETAPEPGVEDILDEPEPVAQEAALFSEPGEAMEEEAAEPEAEEPAPAWEPEGELEPEFEEEDEDDEARARRKRERDRSKQRILEFDERVGRVVARKKRKPSRRQDWEADDEDW